MYRGLLARIGKSKNLDISKETNSDTNSKSGLKTPSTAEKSSVPLEDSKPVFKGKIITRPSIDFGKYDPKWINRASSTPANKTPEKETAEANSMPSNEGSNTNTSLEHHHQPKNDSQNELPEPPSKESNQKSDCKDTELDTPSLDKEVDPISDASTKEDPLLSESTSRPPKRSSDKKLEAGHDTKQPKVDVKMPSCNNTSFGPPMPYTEPYWRRGGPYRGGGGRGRGMNPNWRGSPFSRPFPRSPFYNGMPPNEMSNSFHVPPPLDKVMKHRFSVPPPNVTKNENASKFLSEDAPFNKHLVIPNQRDDNKSSSELVQDQVAPLWKVPYDKQLKLKEDNVLAYMNKLKTETLNANRALHSWYSYQENSYPSICKLHPMTPGPLCVGYQSRCDFIIGLDKDDDDKMIIGFPIEPQTVYVGPVDELKSIPQRIKYVTKSLENYLRTLSYRPYDPVSKEGNWLSCTVRMTVTDEVMMVISFYPQNCEKLQVKQLRLKLKDYFENGDGSLCELTSLYFNEKTIESSGTFELLLGANHISEKICEQYFRITPRIPFCLNSTAVETVFKVMIDICCLDFETTLVDLCCGGGTIGLSLSKYVGQVLGLDIVEEFVNDARMNAVNNNVTNCEFFTGSGEHYLPVLLNRANFSNIVLVVDPPQIPFDSKVICNIRKCSNINRVVWLVSNPNSGMRNFEDLVRPPSNQYKGDPFIPVEVIPVDTLPHTFQFTMIVIFMRVSMRELVTPTEVNFNRFYDHSKASSSTRTQEVISSSDSTPFSDYPAPDLSWKKVEKDVSDESKLSSEQISWLNQMSQMYQNDFDRIAWTENLKQQNRDASSRYASKSTSHNSAPGISFSYPPPSHHQSYTVPPIINSTPSSIPKATGPTPEYWAQYSKQYSSYMMNYNQNSNAQAYMSANHQPGVDPAAWKQYCEQMAKYWAQWATPSSNHKSIVPSSTETRPPLPPTTSYK